MSLFKQHKSLADLEEEEQQLDVEISVARKRAMLKEVERRGGKGSWKLFSDNGKSSGIDWQKIKNWLKNN